MTQPTLTLRILPDEDLPSPRANDNLGTMACWHRRYTMGDVQPKGQPVDYQKALPADTLVVPVYLLDHSGLSVSTRDFADEWDSGQVGFYTMTPAQIEAAYGEDTPAAREQAKKGIEAEMEEYTQYLNGNGWGFVVEDAEGDQVNACWGFLGSDPFENGLVSHLADAELDLLEGAMEKANLGLSFSQAKLEQEKAARAQPSPPGPRLG